MFAATYLTTDPAWPWSLPGFGVGALVGVAAALALLTIWTYFGDQKATPRRIACVLTLRLLALAIALIVVLRPSLARDEEDIRLSSKLLIHLDVSDSMNRPDELGNLSRFEHAKRLLTTGPCHDLLRRLSTERKVEVVYSMGADDVRPLDFSGKLFDKRTDIGGWLHELWQQHGSERNLRGLILLTDGADNGTRFPALEKAAQFRGVCKIFPFGVGETTTTSSGRDISIEKITVDEPVHAKMKMRVKAKLAAPGYEDAVVFVSLFIEGDDGKTMKQIGVKKVLDLRKQTDKTALFEVDAPDKNGEMKVMVKVDPLPGDDPANNEASTYVNVSKEGVSILWVEGKMRWETTFAQRAISKDPRLRVFPAYRLPDAKSKAEADDFFDFAKRHYDVIVIGDLSAQRFSAGNNDVFDKIIKMVQEKGTGLAMLGGYDTFFAGGWHTSRLSSQFPVRFDKSEQLEAKVRVTPTAAGEQFLLKLSIDPVKQKELWTKKLEPFDGIAPLGTLDPTATVQALGQTLSQKDEPVLVSVERGQGRVLAFAADTTHQSWRRSHEAIAAYELFWTQMMLWLAKQEHSKGFLSVKPDTRRLELAKNERIGFTVNFTKGSGKVLQPNFKSKVVGPRGEEIPVTILEENNAYRGYWSGPTAAGEHRIVVEGEGLDDKKQQVTGRDGARFVVFEEDRESLRPAADHELLEKIAAVSGGKFSSALERNLVQFLEELAPLQDASRGAATRWPDWRRNPASNSVRDQTSALWQSTSLPCFLAFATILCLEWFLRRRWGMV